MLNVNKQFSSREKLANFFSDNNLVKMNFNFASFSIQFYKIEYYQFSAQFAYKLFIC